MRRYSVLTNRLSDNGPLTLYVVAESMAEVGAAYPYARRIEYAGDVDRVLPNPCESCCYSPAHARVPTTKAERPFGCSD